MPEWFDLIFSYKDKKSPDKLGKFPQDVQVEALPERRYLWTSRIMVISGVFSLCITIMLAMTIYVLLPQKSSRPSLFEEQEYNSSLRQARPFEVFTNAESMMTEEAIHRYIKLRHEIPRSYAQMADRWSTDSEFYQLSTLGAYQQFVYKMDYDRMARLMAQKMIRNVDIKWVKQLTKNLWAAEFVTATTTKNHPSPAVAVWRAYIRVTFEDFNADTDKNTYLHNPHGFKVKHYSVGYAGNGRGSESYMQSAKDAFDER